MADSHHDQCRIVLGLQSHPELVWGVLAMELASFYVMLVRTSRLEFSCPPRSLLEQVDWRKAHEMHIAGVGGA